METKKQILTRQEFFRENLPIAVFAAENRPEVYPYIHKQLQQRAFWQITYIARGQGRTILNGRRYPIYPGFLCLFHPDDLTVWELEEEITLYHVLFRLDFIEDALKRLVLTDDFFGIFTEGYSPERSINHELLHLQDVNRSILTLIHKMQHEYEQQPQNAEELLRCYLLELLILFARRSSRNLPRRHKEEIVQLLTEYISNNYRQKLDYNKLSAEIGFSRGYLLTIYKQLTGKTIGETLLQYRIKKVQELLCTSNLSIEQICYRCGFSDLANFYRTFKHITGMSPGMYRKSGAKSHFSEIT